MCNGGNRSVRRGQKVSNRQLGDLTHCANLSLRVGYHKSRTAATTVIISSKRAKEARPIDILAKKRTLIAS